jgi:undecaprenyl-diphosphatase
MLWLGASTAGAVLDRGRRDLYLRTIRTVAAVELLNAALKVVVGRQRPRLEDLPALMATRSQRSCPSAHASGSFAAARVLSERLPAVPLYTLACAMALSRPYLGVHYPSDILAGAALGLLIAEIS